MLKAPFRSDRQGLINHQHQTAPFPVEDREVPSCGGHEGESDAASLVQHGVLLGFLDLPLASAFAQLLLGFQRGGWSSSGGSVMVVLLRDTQRRSEQQVANPGLHKGEGGAMRVSGGHHHLRGRGDREEKRF